ncbi:MAG: nonstructural protein [Microvirus sp.]|nr:MAG: nonstructural protein [Microvirus sp.]
MKHLMCSIYDVKANIYHFPFSAPNRAVAMRQFAATVGDPGSLLSKFPADFVLMVVGDFDDSNSSVESYDVVENLCNGSNVKESL